MNERKVFYIDVGNLSKAQASAFLEQIRSQLTNRPIPAEPSLLKKGLDLLGGMHF